VKQRKKDIKRTSRRTNHNPLQKNPSTLYYSEELGRAVVAKANEFRQGKLNYLLLLIYA
jgi:hypothetical protein